MFLWESLTPTLTTRFCFVCENIWNNSANPCKLDEHTHVKNLRSFWWWKGVSSLTTRITIISLYQGWKIHQKPTPSVDISDQEFSCPTERGVQTFFSYFVFTISIFTLDVYPTKLQSHPRSLNSIFRICIFIYSIFVMIIIILKIVQTTRLKRRSKK